jgi:hypothetical protein
VSRLSTDIWEPRYLTTLWVSSQHTAVLHRAMFFVSQFYYLLAHAHLNSSNLLLAHAHLNSSNLLLAHAHLNSSNLLLAHAHLNSSNLLLSGRAVAQDVSRRLPTAAAWVRAQARSRGICGEQSGNAPGSLWVLRVPPPVLITPIALNSSSLLSRSTPTN